MRAYPIIGTLGKAVGSQGAFVASSTGLRQLLWNRARSFVFSTATSPMLSQITLFHVQRVKAEEHLRTLLRANIASLELALHAREVPSARSLGAAIFPIAL